METDGESMMNSCLQAKGLGPFLQIKSDVLRGLCLLPSWWFVSQSEHPEEILPHFLHLPMHWSPAGPYRSQAIWFGLWLGKGAVEHFQH